MEIRFGAFAVDTAAFALSRDAVPVPLEPQEFDVLLYLIRHRERVVTRDELLAELWPGKVVTDGALSARIKSIRRALGDDGRSQRVIGTVHGRGYRFVADLDGDVRVAPGANDAREPAAAAEAYPWEPPGATRAPVAPVGWHPRAADPAAPRAAPGLPGRDDALRRLRERLDVAISGQRQVVAVVGESGIGKSTLIEVLLRDLSASYPQLLVLRGQCLRDSDITEPYLPLVDALARARRRGVDEALDQVLARCAPSWALLFPELRTPAGAVAPADTPVPASRDRMLLELDDAFAVLCRQRALLVVLEDLQWSDASTLEWLDHLARDREPLPVMVLYTVRTGGDRCPALDVTVELASRGRVMRVDLHRLTVEAVAACLEQRLGEPADPYEVERLSDCSAGHPLFLTLLLEGWLPLRRRGVSLDTHLTRLPETAAELVEHELAGLSEAELTLLECASVVGREHDADLVAAAIGAPAPVVEQQLAGLARRFGRPLAVAGTERPDGSVTTRFRFTEELVAQVLYARQSAGLRSRRHLTVARELERLTGPAADQRAGELALHYERAGMLDAAIAHCELGARRALGCGAAAEAALLAQRAVDLLGRSPPSDERDQRELELCLLLAPSLRAIHGWGAASVETLYGRALELADRLGDPVRWATANWDLAVVKELQGEYASSAAILDRQLARRLDTLTLEADELMACSLFHQGQFRRSIEHARRVTQREEAAFSLPMAEFGESPAVCCHAWIALDLWFLGCADQALAGLAEALRGAEAEPHARVTAFVQAAFLHHHLGEPERVRHFAGLTLAVARRDGFTFRAIQAHILGAWVRSVVDGADTAALRTGIERYEETGARMDLPYYLGLLADAELATGGVEAARTALDRAEAALPDRSGFFYAAELLRLRGRMVQAQTATISAPEAVALFVAAAHAADSYGAKILAVRATLAWHAAAPGAEPAARLRALGEEIAEGWSSPDLAALRRVLTEAEGVA